MGESDDIDWGKVGFVDSSTYRTEVLSHLVESRLTPKELSNETPIELSHVSRTLGELKEKDLVELLVPEDQQKGRIYEATEEGKRVWETVESRN
ncbi:winged helix-turn-helix domain-containing protein [Natrinema sp. 74]|uniref:winged helix-turn-helix domain-containing protein n=1 Tax=Natrinema sp. 74 TaxID=3384159 RepID=UPI0038D36021